MGVVGSGVCVVGSGVGVVGVGVVVGIGVVGVVGAGVGLRRHSYESFSAPLIMSHTLVSRGFLGPHRILKSAGRKEREGKR